MARHRTHSIEFKRQVAHNYVAGETLHSLAKRHDLVANPDPHLRRWLAGEAITFDRTPRPSLGSTNHAAS